jgi:hypothetical protein
VSDGPPIFDAPRTFPESNASHIARDGNIDWTATVGRAHLESPRPLTRVAVGERPTPLYRRCGTPRRAFWS